MQFGNRASLEAIPRKFEDVQFPDLDTFYRVREMSGTERDTFEIETFKLKTNGASEPKREVDPKYLRARLAVLCLVDEAGNRLYADNEVKTCSDMLGAGVLNKIFTAAQRLNGLDGGAVEDAAKNSEGDRNDSSTSGSLSSKEGPSLNS